MANDRPGYLAYLVRLWQVTSAGRPVWRASLENPHTGERRGFADLDALVAFLKNKTQIDAGLEDGPAVKRGPAREKGKPDPEDGL